MALQNAINYPNLVDSFLKLALVVAGFGVAKTFHPYLNAVSMLNWYFPVVSFTIFCPLRG